MRERAAAVGGKNRDDIEVSANMVVFPSSFEMWGTALRLIAVVGPLLAP